MIKNILLWVGFFVFLYLAITAVTMHEYVQALVYGVISLASIWLAPLGSSSKKNDDIFSIK